MGYPKPLLFLLLPLLMGQAGPIRPFGAWEVMKALHSAYPQKVRAISYRDRDWAILVEGTWFYWANGKLLPEEALPEEESYDPWPFYTYPKEHLPPLWEFPEREAQRIRERLAARQNQPSESRRNRHQGLYDTLFGIKDQNSAERMNKPTTFLGLPLRVHKDLILKLQQVEEEIKNHRGKDKELDQFIDSLQSFSGYNWRQIANSANRSYHSYGVAIDYIPKEYEDKAVYWYWTMDTNPNWFLLPWEERLYPPAFFVKAFEKQGFIWGGKWLFFDTIHFEYRPELLILNKVF